MVVKDKIGRKRYIVSYSNMKKVDLDAFLRDLAIKYQIKASIIVYNNGFNILRCKHLDKDRLINILNSKNFKTYKVTGTIKKAKEIVSMINY
jgi:hypothetical protein